MNANEKLQLIQALDEQQRARSSRASLLAWASVVAAAVVLGVMIFAANRELKQIEAHRDQAISELASTNQKLTALQADVQQLEATKRQLRDEIRGLQTLLETLPESQRKDLVAQTLQKKPDTAGLVPRIYMQIVQKEDRTFAQGIAQQLREAGFLVVGIEYVPNVSLTHSDVRFYHKAERPLAEQILAALQNAGEQSAVATYLEKYENNTTARPNHFEVWLKQR